MAHSTLGPPRRRSRRAGFTLVEVMVVVAIMAIIATVGIVRFTRTSVLLTQGERTARTLVGDLRHAHSQAVATGKNHYLLFTDGGAKYSDYAIFRVEAGSDVKIVPTRVLIDTCALTGSDTRAEFTPTGDALGSYTYSITEPPGHTYNIAVVLATGAVTLVEP